MLKQLALSFDSLNGDQQGCRSLRAGRIPETLLARSLSSYRSSPVKSPGFPITSRVRSPCSEIWKLAKKF